MWQWQENPDILVHPSVFVLHFFVLHNEGVVFVLCGVGLAKKKFIHLFKWTMDSWLANDQFGWTVFTKKSNAASQKSENKTHNTQNKTQHKTKHNTKHTNTKHNNKHNTTQHTTTQHNTAPPKTTPHNTDSLIMNEALIMKNENEERKPECPGFSCLVN